VDQGELRDKALDVFALLLRRIARMRVSAELDAISDRVGARRAEQEVSLAEVQAAANLDFHVVWNALLSEATDDEAGALLRQAPMIWSVVDAHTQRITQSYRRRRDELDHLSDDRRREWFGRLLKSNGERPEIVQRAADVLGLEPDGRFRAVVAPRECAARLREVRDTLTALRWSLHHQELEVGDVLVVQTSARSEQRLMNSIAGLRCAVAPPSFGLDDVPRSTKIAGDILMALPPDRTAPGFLEDAWLKVAANQAPLVATALSDRIERALDGVNDAGVLIETARVFCDGDGTVTRTASELFCHRNTVLNRLERLKDLTGYDVRRPRDAATFLFAMSTRG
jgi:sugar diacid utilization regulator